MKNFDNYVCDGQISLWDIFKPEKPKIEPNDSICEGCKWRNNKDRFLEVDEHGQTWVYRCPGTACANWKHGTPLNISCEEKWISEEEKRYCYNRDFLPEIEYLIPILEEEYDCKFVKGEFCGTPEYIYKYRGAKITVSDSNYSYGDKKRFVGVSWDIKDSGFASPCDNLHEVMHWMSAAFEWTDKWVEEKKRAKNGKNTN